MKATPLLAVLLAALPGCRREGGTAPARATEHGGGRSSAVQAEERLDRAVASDGRVAEVRQLPDGSEILVDGWALVPDDGGFPSRPVWSPDGRAVAYVSSRTGVASWWVVDAGGGTPPRQLTNVGLAPGQGLGDGFVPPPWRPGVALWADGWISWDAGGEVWMCREDGRGAHRVRSTGGTPTALSEGRLTVVSPDGRAEGVLVGAEVSP